MSGANDAGPAEHVDYYAVLELTKGALDTDIKKAYRRLAMKWHPDKNASNAQEAARKFQEIAEAYDVLTDKEKRAIYDQFGYEGLRDGVVDGHGATRPGYGKPNAQEIFEQFFGTANPFADFGYNDALPFGSKLKKPGPKKAAPVNHDLSLSLEELFNGCTKRLTITRKRYTGEGVLVDSSKVLTISVKPGWKKGTKVTYPCEGDEGPTIIPADVIFTVVEKPHSHFTREGNNLIFTAKVHLVDALTDCCIEVPTLDGRTLSLPCPEVLNPGYQKYIPNEGMPLSKEPNNRGELVVRFDVLFPKYISEEKKAKLRNLLAHPAAAH